MHKAGQQQTFPTPAPSLSSKTKHLPVDSPIQDYDLLCFIPFMVAEQRRL
jgi:hypothetical protein